MDALLVTVPVSLLRHGADHQIHAVGCLHKRRVIAYTHEMNIRGHLLTVGDLPDRRVDGLHVRLNTFTGKNRKDLPHVFSGAVQNTLNFRLSDLFSVIVVGLPDHFRQNDRPGEIDRQNIGPVNNSNAGIKRIFLLLRRDQVDPDSSGAIRI